MSFDKLRMTKEKTMNGLYRVKFTDIKGNERQFSDLTLDEVAKVFVHASLLKPVDVLEMRNGKAV